jgi:hypothetical protein
MRFSLIASDLPHPTEAHLISTFSLSFVVMLGTLVAIAVAWAALQLLVLKFPPSTHIKTIATRRAKSPNKHCIRSSAMAWM